MSVVVTKSPVMAVGPCEPELMATGCIINLSSFDKCFIPLPMALLLVFDQPMDNPVETIKKALSQALVHYYPMAGRLVAGAKDEEEEEEELSIACTGDGVSFVAASAGCTLQEAMIVVKDLTVSYPAELCRHGDPLLLMQVTEFSCGGFAVGVTWNHILADGVGMSQFLQAVGELARGKPAPSVAPVRSDDSLPRFPPPMVAAMRSQMRLETEELLPLDVTVPLSLISRVKAECDGGCTLLDVVAAVLWLCRTRAAFSGGGGEDPVLLTMVTDLRAQVGAKPGYYGNCTTMRAVLATSGTVAGSEIRDLVQLIKRAKESRELFKNGSVPTEVVATLASRRYNVLSVSSWLNLGLDTVDLGRGTPATVMWQPEKMAGFLCVVCPPCSNGGGGVNVVSLCVKPQHADAFLRELATLVNM